MMITDTYNGNSAKVDANKRLHTESVNRTVLTEAVFKGEAFNFNTGAITLTSGSESALGYLDYQGDDPFIITEILFIVGSATGTLTSDGTAKILRNPTGGTIVSGAVPIETAANRDFSSSISVTGDMFKEQKVTLLQVELLSLTQQEATLSLVLSLLMRLQSYCVKVIHSQ